MGMFMASVAFRCDDKEKWASIRPRIEAMIQQGRLVNNFDSAGPGYGMLSPYGDMEMELSRLPARISALTGGYAVFATCVDSDFCLMELYRGGELVNKGCIGEAYEELVQEEQERMGQLALSAWQPLLLEQSRIGELNEALFGETVFAEDHLRLLTELTGLPILADEMMLEGENMERSWDF